MSKTGVNRILYYHACTKTSCKNQTLKILLFFCYMFARKMIVSIKYVTISFPSKIGTNGENLEIKRRNTKFHLHDYVCVLLTDLSFSLLTQRASLKRASK
jgi:hypothetical protein